jgi:ribonuclease Z
MTLRATFLGTSGAIPTAQRNTSAVFVSIAPHNRESTELLFDCGEGTQRQMMGFGTGFSISHIFISHCHGDHVLGLPGLCQTMAFNDREDGLAIHTPHGTRPVIERLVGTTGTRPDFPIRINEVGPSDVALDGKGFTVRAFETDHRTTSVGYALVEDDRKGRFDRERAEELGVPVGPKFSALQDGESVISDDGTTIHPEQVVGPPRPGRRAVYTGDTRPTDATIEAARGADLLIHDATFADDWADRAVATAHSTGAEAAMIARRADTKRLALTHISSRYAGDPGPIAREASATFEGEVVLPDDGTEIDVPYPDAE